MIPFCLQAMVISESKAMGLTGLAVVTSLGAMIQSHAQQHHVMAFLSSGAFVGSMASYWLWREYTPSQRVKRAQEALNVVKQSKIGYLLLLDDKDITVDKINQIPTNSGYSCVVAMREATMCDALLDKHSNWIDPVKDYDLRQNLLNNKKKVGMISAVIQTHDNGTMFAAQLKRFKEEEDGMVKLEMLGNEKNKTAILKSEATTKRLEVAKWYLWKAFYLVCAFPIWFPLTKILWTVYLS